MTTITAVLAALLLLCAIPAYADGGGPILLMASFYLFVVGQVWIVFSEFVYMKVLHKEETARSIIKVVASMNLVSMVLGGLALPFLLALVGLVGALMLGNPNWKTVGEYILAAGTWVVGDNSPHAPLALTSAGIGFVGTYFITVYVERWYLNRRTRNNSFPHTSLLHCYCINATSYIGLVALMVLPGYLQR